ncbi:hypothetical protein KFE25_013735 [Diacronema lutheri]|uniref:Mitochondrial carrier protein n=1 Tax=Diacronema lutheri TaxID=2081491 RepID=A0A8J6CBF1_DIALT|nr:hypothetical protein KFE25_013735 [Diacronema lutheri]
MEVGEEADYALSRTPPGRTVRFDDLDKTRFFGAGAGLYTALTVGLYPLHSQKTRAQALSEHAPATRKPPSMFGQVLAPGAFRGVGVAVTGALPARIGYIYALEAGGHAATAWLAARGVRPETAASFGGACGGAAAAATSMAVYIPFDIVSQRQIVSSAAPESAATIARHIVRTEGVRGLYRGFAITVLTYLPSSALWWGTYKAVREAIEGSAPHTPMLAADIASGAVAGALTSTVTMPLDTVKTRVQTQAHSADGQGALGLVRVTRELLVAGGASALWRGVFWRATHTVVWGCTMIVCYEQLKRWAVKPRARLRSHSRH